MVTQSRPHQTQPQSPFSSNSRPLQRPRPRPLVCKASARNDLLRAVFEAARQQTAPWVADLAIPALGIRDQLAAQATATPTLPPSALADPTSRFASLPCGVTLHYKQWAGSTLHQHGSTKPLILLMHGFNASEFSWRAVGPILAEATGCSVVAFDRPPFGLSSRPLEWGQPGQALQFNPYELSGSARLAADFLEYLRARNRVVVIGHSAGAMVALELYRQRPEAVSSLVLVAPAVPSTPENSMQRRVTLGAQLRFLVSRAVLQSDRAGLTFVRRQLLRQKNRVAAGELGFKPHPLTVGLASVSTDGVLSNPLSLDDEGGDAFVTDADEDMALQAASEGYLKPIRAHDWDKAALLNLRSLNWPMHYEYDAVKVPVLVVTGEHDGGLTKNARALVKILQNRPGDQITRFVEFPCCAHVPMEELPVEFNEAVIDFVKSTST